jgi:hypothetical protein
MARSSSYTSLTDVAQAGALRAARFRPGFIEVTEATFVVGRFRERSRYRPGSTWELRAGPHPEGGSSVQASLRRRHRLFGWHLGTVLRANERDAPPA